MKLYKAVTGRTELEFYIDLGWEILAYDQGTRDEDIELFLIVNNDES